MRKKIICLLFFTMFIIGLTIAYHCFAVATSKQFTDVLENEWYAESVEYVYRNRLMNGITETSFEPETHITRGMIVTIIYRMEASPKTNGDLKFDDVNEAYYYAEPVIWATKNNIVNGYDEKTFAPEDKITREQFATILYRYAKFKGLDVSVDENVSKQFKAYSDSGKISDYAKDTMLWANSKKLITGVTTTTLVPGGIATRAQAATIFMRFDKLLKRSKDDSSDVKFAYVENNESENKELNNKQNNSPDREGSRSKSDVKSNKTSEDNQNDGNGKIDSDNNACEWDDVKDTTNNNGSK